jgi:outer membrane protein assembly factor BamB
MKPIIVLVLVLVATVGLTMVMAHRPSVQRLRTGDPPKIEIEPDPEPDKRRSDIEINDHNSQVIRRDSDGRIVWSTHLDGYLGGVRPPHVLHDANRVFVTHKDGVTALDAQTGKVLWQSAGPNDRLCLSKDLLIATECSMAECLLEKGRWVTARAVDTGAEVFRVPLPLQDFDPLAIEEVAGLFLVQTHEDTGGHGNGLLIDRKGQVRHRFDRQVITGRLRGEDRVFLTSRDVVCLTADDKPRWAVPFRDGEWIAGGDLVDVDGGDLLAFLYGHINDSGVQVVRLNPQTGQEVWETWCSPLGVPHSKYRHWATVRMDGEHLKVTSRASGGTFVELLDLQTGQRLGRRVGDR